LAALNLPCGGGVAADSMKINDIVIAGPLQAAQREATLKPSALLRVLEHRRRSLAEAGLAETLPTHLPPGRPQGRRGRPSLAPLRVPCRLKVTVEKMIVLANTSLVHMSFTGHFTGSFGQTQGKGRRSPSSRRSRQGRERPHHDNWHIEDNLTLLQQMGVAKLDS